MISSTTFQSFGTPLIVFSQNTNLVSCLKQIYISVQQIIKEMTLFIDYPVKNCIFQTNTRLTLNGFPFVTTVLLWNNYYEESCMKSVEIRENYRNVIFYVKMKPFSFFSVLSLQNITYKSLTLLSNVIKAVFLTSNTFKYDQIIQNRS